MAQDPISSSYTQRDEVQMGTIDHCALQNTCKGGMKIHRSEKINVILAEKMGTSTSKIIPGVSARKFIPGVKASNGDNNGGKFVGGAFVSGMCVGGAFVRSMFMLEAHSFEACLCWRLTHWWCPHWRRCCSVSFQSQSTTINKKIKLAELSRETHL